jgi:hypothetical protein
MRMQIRKLHKWLGLIIGLQIAFWTIGGLIMSAFPLERVHGDHTRRIQQPEPLDLETILPVRKVLEIHDLDAVKVTLVGGFDGPQYQVTKPDEEISIINAQTGNIVLPLTMAQAKAIAADQFSGDGRAVHLTRLTDTTTEYRGPVPAWRVEFDDWESTTLYVNENSGRVMASRNTMWRIFDFVWMLHIMDYRDRSDFNHPLLIFAALVAVILTGSGIYMVARSIKRGEFRPKNKKA